MSGWLNKIDTCMNTIINDIRPMRFILSLKIRIKSGLDAFKNRLPTSLATKKRVWWPILIIDEITESRGIDDIESQSNAIFLDIGTDGTDTHSLGNFHWRRTSIITRTIQIRVKKSIDQRWFSQSTFSYSLVCQYIQFYTYDHDIEIESLSNGFSMPLIW